jgi:hypothetical protein
VRRYSTVQGNAMQRDTTRCSTLTSQVERKTQTEREEEREERQKESREKRRTEQHRIEQLR